MATRVGKVTRENSGPIMVFWEGLLDNDVGAGVDVGRFVDKAAQTVGVFSAATITWQGSMDNVVYGDIGAAVTQTDNTVKSIPALVKFIRPNAGAAGDANTDLDCFLLCMER